MSCWPTCPICGSNSHPAFYAGDHRMFRCGACGVAFVYPLPSSEYLEAFYSRFHLALDAGGGYETTEARMSADFPAKLDKIRAHLRGASARMLDVGCGKGFFVKAAGDAGFCAEGIDLSDTAVAFARDALGVRAACGRIEEGSATLGKFDAVTFWATIEHLPDPEGTLRAIHAVLKPGGLLFLDTGIGNDWLDRLLPGVNQWYDPPQHLYVFSAAAMRLCLLKVGFEIVDLDRSFERSYCRRVARAARGVVAAAGFRAVASVTRCFGGGEAFPFTRFALGNLMMVVARKSDGG